jgi:glycosyltransferase involved in cell wall biosynthesis
MVLEHMADCHVLLHPSLHDSGGMVVTEAMAAGRPVICLNLGGPALQVVDGETGYKVEAISPEQAINAIEQDMIKLAENPELRRNMGEASRRRVQECLKWEHHAAAAQKIYAELVAPKS